VTIIEHITILHCVISWC